MPALPYTVSALERVRNCPASAVLPRVVESSDDAGRGTVCHDFARRVLSGESVAAALKHVGPKEQDMCKRLDFAKAIGDLGDVRAEAAFALDLDTDTPRATGITGRHYTATGELHGTIDATARRKFDGMPVVADWKFGFIDVPPVAENAQVSFFARVRSALEDAPEVEGRIWKVAPNGSVHVSRHVFDALDLDAFGDELRTTRARVHAAKVHLDSGGAPEVSAGDWCRYCPSIDVCPRQTALARAMLPELETIGAKVLAMTPEQGGQAWLTLKRITTIAERIEDSLKLLARHSPLPVGDGKEVRPSPVTRHNFSRKAAEETMRRHGIPTEEIEACVVAATHDEFRTVNVRR